MRKKLIFKLMLLSIIGFMVIVLSYRYLDGLNESVLVYVAAYDIPEETIVEEDMVKSMSIGYEEKVRFFSTAYDSLDLVVGKVTQTVISEGDVFSEKSMLLQDGESHDVIGEDGEVKSDYFIDRGQRIAFISLPKTKALGGHIKKGNKIDLIYTSKSDHTGGMYSSLLLQHIEVFSVEEASSDVNIQLIVKPEQGMLLSLAKYNGELDLMLGNELSDEVDIIPKLPQDLYEKLLEAGYLLVDQAGRNVSTLNESSSRSIEDLEKELTNAEKNLEAAFNAMNAAKAALDSEKNERSKKDLYTLVQELESAVRDLEVSVEGNKVLLETMKGDEYE